MTKGDQKVHNSRWCQLNFSITESIKLKTIECNRIIDVRLTNIIEHQSNTKNLVKFSKFWLFGIWTITSQKGSLTKMVLNIEFIYKLYLIFFDHYVWTQNGFVYVSMKIEKKSNTIEIKRNWTKQINQNNRNKGLFW